ncbi:MAG TPA: protein YgfX [Paucimonas sp.]|nr:protein YgfX [Paucimonas sp.]
MSIALSVVIKPSRLVLAMVGAICLGCASIGISIGFGLSGELHPAVRIVLACLCVCASIDGLWRAIRMGKTHHVDISGIGQIRLVETTALADPAFCGSPPDSVHAGELVSLMDDSTLWPFLLLLRLRTENGRIKTVIVLPDSADRAEFRALSVACRWIVAHSGSMRQSTSSKMLS